MRKRLVWFKKRLHVNASATRKAAIAYTVSTVKGCSACAGHWPRNSGRISSTAAVSASPSEMTRITPGKGSGGKNTPLRSLVGVRNSET